MLDLTHIRDELLDTCARKLMPFCIVLDELGCGVLGGRSGGSLVVLCFEGVHGDQVCHRRWFADWMAARFGIVVDEVDPPSNPQGRLALG